MKKQAKAMVGSLILACSLALIGSVLAANGPVIERSVFGSGGEQSKGGSLILNGTLGEPIAGGFVPEANYGLGSGYWWPRTSGGPSGPCTMYLPAVLRNYRTWDTYYEENDDWLDAYGPLVSGRTYLAYPDDTEDYYYFVLSASATVNVSVTDFAPTSSNGTVMLYGPAVGSERGNLIEYYGPPGQSSMSLGPHSLGPGKYYVRVNTAKDYSTTQLYHLTVTY